MELQRKKEINYTKTQQGENKMKPWKKKSNFTLVKPFKEQKAKKKTHKIKIYMQSKITRKLQSYTHTHTH